MKIAVTGAGGLVGSALRPWLASQMHTVVPVLRSSNKKLDSAIYWDPSAGTIEGEKFEGLDAVVHLAGENVASGRWNEEKKKKILNSRVKGTEIIAKALAKLQNPPKVFVSASAIGFYGNRGNETLTESSPAGNNFLATVGKNWEAATKAAEEKGIRVVHLRIGMVLSSKGGALAKMLPPFQSGAGGALGSGKQYMSWIDIEDLVSAITYAIENDKLSGAVNAVSPTPATNNEFTKTLGKVLGKPVFMPMPEFAVKLMFGELADELLLSSCRVLPKKLLDNGYKFNYAELESALKHVLDK